jgi:hypothetical protein
MVATLPLEGAETYMLLLFELGWSHPERGTKDVLKMRTSFLKTRGRRTVSLKNKYSL